MFVGVRFFFRWGLFMKSLQSAILVLVFSAGVFLVYNYLIGGFEPVPDDAGPTNNTGFLKTESEFRFKLAELRMDQEKVVRRKNLLMSRKKETVELLKSKGINAESDLSDKDVKYAARNLKRTVAEMKKMDVTVAKYEKAIVAIEAMLNEMERDRIAAEVAISDEKAEELGIMILDLDERLADGEDDIFEDDELREILGMELGSDAEELLSDE